MMFATLIILIRPALSSFCGYYLLMEDFTSILYPLLGNSPVAALLFWFLNRLTNKIGHAVTKLQKTMVEDIKPALQVIADKLQHNINESESIKKKLDGLETRVEDESRRTQDQLMLLASKRNGIK